MLLYRDTDNARNAIHQLFTHEKVKETQFEAHPRIRPVRSGVHGQEFLVVHRDKDRVHIRGMDAAGSSPKKSSWS